MLNDEELQSDQHVYCYGLGGTERAYIGVGRLAQIITQAREANALRAEVERLRDAIDRAEMDVVMRNGAWIVWPRTGIRGVRR